LRTLYPTADIQIGIEDLADYAANTCKLTRATLKKVHREQASSVD
jgi:hypothetical protein